MTVLIYVDSKGDGDPDHLKVFAHGARFLEARWRLYNMGAWTCSCAK